jgi:putative NADH-flavin reductase
LNISYNGFSKKEIIMKIAILGSTGFVGNILIKKAVAAGYQIKTLARNPEKLEDIKDKVEIIHGSVFEPSTVEATIEGTEAVLSTIGPPPRNPGNPEQYEKAMKDIVTIMNKNGIKRYIHIGGAGHLGGENENWTLNRRLLRFFLNLFGKPILVAKHLEWEVLKNSDLDWTLVRPPQIRKGRSNGRIVANEKNLLKLQVSVEDLVDFMLDQIESKEWIKKAPLVATIKQKN